MQTCISGDSKFFSFKCRKILRFFSFFFARQFSSCSFSERRKKRAYVWDESVLLVFFFFLSVRSWHIHPLMCFFSFFSLHFGIYCLPFFFSSSSQWTREIHVCEKASRKMLDWRSKRRNDKARKRTTSTSEPKKNSRKQEEWEIWRCERDCTKKKKPATMTRTRHRRTSRTRKSRKGETHYRHWTAVSKRKREREAFVCVSEYAHSFSIACVRLLRWSLWCQCMYCVCKCVRVGLV